MELDCWTELKINFRSLSESEVFQNFIWTSDELNIQLFLDCLQTCQEVKDVESKKCSYGCGGRKNLLKVMTLSLAVGALLS